VISTLARVNSDKFITSYSMPANSQAVDFYNEDVTIKLI